MDDVINVTGHRLGTAEVEITFNPLFEVFTRFSRGFHKVFCSLLGVADFNYRLARSLRSYIDKLINSAYVLSEHTLIN